MSGITGTSTLDSELELNTPNNAEDNADSERELHVLRIKFNTKHSIIGSQE